MPISAGLVALPTFSKMETEVKKSKEELIADLQKEVEIWQERTFSHVQLEVVEHWAGREGGHLSEHIIHPSVEDSVLDWLYEKDECELLTEHLEQLGEESESIEAKIEEFTAFTGDIQKSFIGVFGEEAWDTFKEFCSDQYGDDIQEFIYEQENYPMWNTLFEFKESFFNMESGKCLLVGLGVIEGLEPFNNIVFMTSAGHSFYSAYWIPLYLALNNHASDKYSSISPSDYQHL
jgi:hypothetical protein